MGWWDPFGGAVGAFSGFPAAGADEWVVAFAGEGECVDVGVSAAGPFVDVVHLGEVAGNVAAGGGAAAVLAVQHDSLVGGGNAFGAPEVEGAFGVVVKDAQVVPEKIFC